MVFYAIDCRLPLQHYDSLKIEDKKPFEFHIKINDNQ
jgi:hypothetical protein